MLLCIKNLFVNTKLFDYIKFCLKIRRDFFFPLPEGRKENWAVMSPFVVYCVLYGFLRSYRNLSICINNRVIETSTGSCDSFVADWFWPFNRQQWASWKCQGELLACRKLAEFPVWKPLPVSLVKSDQDIHALRVTYAVFKISSAMPFFLFLVVFVTGAVYYREKWKLQSWAVLLMLLCQFFRRRCTYCLSTGFKPIEITL